MLGARAEVEVRKIEASDAAALAEVFRDSWRNAYRGILPHAVLEVNISRRGPEWWERQAKSSEPCLVAEVAGVVAGYATFGQARTRHRYQGEIYELYLSPVYQGLGYGEHLFEACRYQLDQNKLKGLVVWALSDNLAAMDFYWRRGGRPFARAFDTMGGARLPKTAFGWS